PDFSSVVLRRDAIWAAKFWQKVPVGHRAGSVAAPHGPGVTTEASTCTPRERGLKSAFARGLEHHRRGHHHRLVPRPQGAPRGDRRARARARPGSIPIGARPSGAAVGARAVDDLILEGAGADEVTEARALDLAARGLRDRPGPDEEHARGPVATGREDPAHDLLDQVRVRLGGLAGLAYLRDHVDPLGACALAVDAHGG